MLFLWDMRQDPGGISVVIPARNAAATITDLIHSLKDQTVAPHDITVVDDGSRDGTGDIARRLEVRVLRNDESRGPAISRNRGVRESSGGIIAFVDADCVCRRDWIEQIQEVFRRGNTEAAMGKVIFDPKSILARAIAGLGLPAGGTVGFENLWRVEPDGRTHHISSCNFAARRDVFDAHGGFDTRFPLAGGEDVELAERWSRNGVRIRYCPEVQIEHASRDSLTGFIRWHVYRGRSNVYLRRVLGTRRSSSMLSERFGAFSKIALKSFRERNFYLVLPLLLLMTACQLVGYGFEALRFRNLRGAQGSA